MVLKRNEWKRILTDYQSDESLYLICNLSPTFQEKWSSLEFAKEAVKKAGCFLRQTNQLQWSVGTAILFRSVYENPENQRQIRIDFLKWMIENS